MTKNDHDTLEECDEEFNSLTDRGSQRESMKNKKVGDKRNKSKVKGSKEFNTPST